MTKFIYEHNDKAYVVHVDSASGDITALQLIGNDGNLDGVKENAVRSPRTAPDGGSVVGNLGTLIGN
ncbi:MAG: hypothetical protein RIM72_00375 [Alphaproteobacteria bacterium]